VSVAFVLKSFDGIVAVAVKPAATRGEISVTTSRGKDLASNESYQMVNSKRRIAIVSEHQADPISENEISNTAASATGAGDAAQAATSGALEIDSPKLAPEMNGSAEAGKLEAPKVEVPKIEAPRASGKIMIMAPSHERAWSDTAETQEEPAKDQAAANVLSKRRISAIAAVIALAAVAGALGGALATAGLGHLNADDTTKTAGLQARALEESIMRLDADIAALKKQSVAQAGKIGDRFDRIEKAQAEPVAKLARLSDAVEKLKATPTPAPQPVAAVAAPAPKEVTGSIQAPVPTPAPKPEIARLPTVEGWVLRDVANGGAMIEGRQGIYEVYAGDPVPGLGRVDAIRKQDGRWVVVTSKGLIVAR
jgi:hypothetical protein